MAETLPFYDANYTDDPLFTVAADRAARFTDAQEAASGNVLSDECWSLCFDRVPNAYFFTRA